MDEGRGLHWGIEGGLVLIVALRDLRARGPGQRWPQKGCNSLLNLLLPATRIKITPRKYKEGGGWGGRAGPLIAARSELCEPPVTSLGPATRRHWFALAAHGPEQWADLYL